MRKLKNGWQQVELLPGIVLDVFHWTSARPGKHALITGGIHGDEYEGPASIMDFTAAFEPARLAGSVTAIPIANTPAYRHGTRTNPEDGLNLARCFPGDPAGKPTEQLAAAIFSSFAEGADYLIDLHSGGVEYMFLPVAGFYGPPTPDNPSFLAAQRFGLPALWQLPATRGVLSNELHARGAAVIGNEYLGVGQLSEAGVAAYWAGIMNCLAHWKMYGDAQPFQGAQRVFTGDWQLARTSGLFRAQVALGQSVKAGQALAEILNPQGAVLETVRAVGAGIVGAIRSKAYIRESNWAVLVLSDAYAE